MKKFFIKTMFILTMSTNASDKPFVEYISCLSPASKNSISVSTGQLEGSLLPHSDESLLTKAGTEFGEIEQPNLNTSIKQKESSVISLKDPNSYQGISTKIDLIVEELLTKLNIPGISKSTMQKIGYVTPAEFETLLSQVPKDKKIILHYYRVRLKNAISARNSRIKHQGIKPNSPSLYQTANRGVPSSTLRNESLMPSEQEGNEELDWHTEQEVLTKSDSSLLDPKMLKGRGIPRSNNQLLAEIGYTPEEVLSLTAEEFKSIIKQKKFSSDEKKQLEKIKIKKYQRVNSQRYRDRKRGGAPTRSKINYEDPNLYKGIRAKKDPIIDNLLKTLRARSQLLNLPTTSKLTIQKISSMPQGEFINLVENVLTLDKEEEIILKNYRSKFRKLVYKHTKTNPLLHQTTSSGSSHSTITDEPSMSTNFLGVTFTPPSHSQANNLKRKRDTSSDQNNRYPEKQPKKRSTDQPEKINGRLASTKKIETEDQEHLAVVKPKTFLEGQIDKSEQGHSALSISRSSPCLENDPFIPLTEQDQLDFTFSESFLDSQLPASFETDLEVPKEFRVSALDSQIDLPVESELSLILNDASKIFDTLDYDLDLNQFELDSILKQQCFHTPIVNPTETPTYPILRTNTGIGLPRRLAALNAEISLKRQLNKLEEEIDQSEEETDQSEEENSSTLHPRIPKDKYYPVNPMYLNRDLYIKDPKYASERMIKKNDPVLSNLYSRTGLSEADFCSMKKKKLNRFIKENRVTPEEETLLTRQVRRVKNRIYARVARETKRAIQEDDIPNDDCNRSETNSDSQSDILPGSTLDTHKTDKYRNPEVYLPPKENTKRRVEPSAELKEKFKKLNDKIEDVYTMDATSMNQFIKNNNLEEFKEELKIIKRRARMRAYQDKTLRSK